jgi:hypothetical protein
MIEFTLTEIVLFCWAILATGYAVRFASEVMNLKLMLKTLAYDSDMRDRFVKHFSTTKEHGA